MRTACLSALLLTLSITPLVSAQGESPPIIIETTYEISRFDGVTWGDYEEFDPGTELAEEWDWVRITSLVEVPQDEDAVACCLPDGTCEELTPDDCSLAGGLAGEPDSGCDDVDCAAPIACCMEDDTCDDLAATACLLMGGTPRALGSTCAETDCTIPPQPPEGEEDQLELYYYLYCEWVPIRPYYAPEGPPVPGATGYLTFRAAAFEPAEVLHQYYVYIDFMVPEFSGQNQARLEGLIPFDVLYYVEYGIWESESAEPIDPVPYDNFLLSVFEEVALSPQNNPPPFADAGADRMVQMGTATTLDASFTFDSYNIGFNDGDTFVIDRDHLTYAWEWVSGPAEPVLEPDLVEPWLARVTFARDGVPPADFLGVHTFRVTVTDGVHLMPSSDIVLITVVEELPVNQRPHAVILKDFNEPAVVGGILVLDGSHSTDPDGDQLNYRWRQTSEIGSDLPPADFADRFQPLGGLLEPVSEWQATKAGTFYFMLLVDDGVDADSEFVQVTVTDAPAAGETAENDAGGDGPAAGLRPAACGPGMLPLALLPLLLLPLRGRIR